MPDINKRYFALSLLAILSVIAPYASAYGYGTSSISFAHQNVSVAAGSSLNANYTVNLATGQSWGTMFQLAKAAPSGITVSVSHPSNYSVPFSGYLTIQVAASTAPGQYPLVFMATGDDPTTQNATLIVNVPSPTTVPAMNHTSNSMTSNGMSNTVVQTAGSTALPQSSVVSTVYYQTSGSSNSWSSSSSGSNAFVLEVFLALVVILTLYSLIRWKMMTTRLIVIGVALILIGTAVWLYGDYGAGPQYIWPGVIGIGIGTVLWIYADWKAGAFKMPAKK